MLICTENLLARHNSWLVSCTCTAGFNVHITAGCIRACDTLTQTLMEYRLQKQLYLHNSLSFTRVFKKFYCHFIFHVYLLTAVV